MFPEEEERPQKSSPKSENQEKDSNLEEAIRIFPTSGVSHQNQNVKKKSRKNNNNSQKLEFEITNNNNENLVISNSPLGIRRIPDFDVQSGVSSVILPFPLQGSSSKAPSLISAATFYPHYPLEPIPPEPHPHPHNPYLSRHRPSFIRSTRTLFMPEGGNPNMPGVDENIYHWKVLNLSRAKLKASSRTSALLSGFAMVAMVEIQIDDKVPEPILIGFAVCTVLLIAVHMLALMISTCILPNVEAVANLHYQTQKTVFESPHMKMNFLVGLAWAFSTVLGILLFLVEIAVLCWVKFYSVSHTVAWVATGLLIPIMLIFIAFAAHFYLTLVSHKSEVYEDGIKELQLLKDQLEDPDQDQRSLSPESSRRAVQIV